MGLLMIGLHLPWGRRKLTASTRIIPAYCSNLGSAQANVRRQLVALGLGMVEIALVLVVRSSIQKVQGWPRHIFVRMLDVVTLYEEMATREVRNRRR